MALSRCVVSALRLRRVRECCYQLSAGHALLERHRRVDDALPRARAEAVFRDRVELVEHGLCIDAFARESRWIEHFGKVAAAIGAGRADRARKGARRASIERTVA